MVRFYDRGYRLFLLELLDQAFQYPGRVYLSVCDYDCDFLCAHVCVLLNERVHACGLKSVCVHACVLYHHENDYIFSILSLHAQILSFHLMDCLYRDHDGRDDVRDCVHDYARDRDYGCVPLLSGNDRPRYVEF